MLNRVITLVAISATVTTIRLYKENRRLRRQLDNGVKIVTTQSETLLYMMDCMERYEISFDQFDVIAFEEIARGLIGGGA